MYILWWAIALLVACLFFWLELRLWRAGTERAYSNKSVVLPGRRWQYRTVAFAIGFVGFMALMLGVLDYAGISFQSLQGTICWLIGALVVGLINLVSVGARLKYFDFKDK